MRYTVIIYSMLLGILFFACKQETSSTKSAKRYVADFYVRYLEEERNLKATASFFEKTDTSRLLLPWSPEKNVLFQASSMEKRTIQNGVVRYIKESSGLSFMAPFQFSFADGRQKVVLQMDPIGLLTLEKAPSKKTGIQLTVEQGQLKESESMVFLFSDADNRAYSHTIDGPHPENTYSLSEDDIAEWPSGEGQLYLIKKKQKTEESGNWMYQTQIEFYSKTLSFLLKN